MKETLEDSVTRHLIADRPVGIFLSGGVDSGAVAHLAARHGRARCLTMIFPEAADDEGPAAARVAAELGVEHLQVPIRGVEIAEDLGAILASMDQPTSDGVNTWLVARAAHDAGVDRGIVGSGGRRAFRGGYPSFRIVPRLASITRIVGSGSGVDAREGGGRALGSAPREPSRPRTLRLERVWQRLRCRPRLAFVS